MKGLGWLVRIAVFGALWWVLTEGSLASWVIGGPVVLIAAYLSRSLQSTRTYQVNPLGLVRFLVFFLGESIKGGIDVGGRALLPGRRTSPYFLEYRSYLPNGWPLALFANTISLLPGTLTARFDEDRLILHALANDMRPLEGVQACERHVAEMFSLPVSTLETEL
jgi:multicomponent Na+:H+ antiporter subunit E